MVNTGLPGMCKNTSLKLRGMYRALEAFYGDLGWWPSETPFEVMIGAILTQNTSWSNVEKAISSLKNGKAMDPCKITAMETGQLEDMIYSAGYYRVKASRIKGLCAFLRDECGGDISRLKKRRQEGLRKSLLGIKGIGPETADSILLYALEKPVFVVDAYTKRIFSRHGIIREDPSYDVIQGLVRDNFPGGIKTYNQFHALIVEVSKDYCRKRRPLCESCPLLGQLKKYRK